MILTKIFFFPLDVEEKNIKILMIIFIALPKLPTFQWYAILLYHLLENKVVTLLPKKPLTFRNVILRKIEISDFFGPLDIHQK